MIAAAAKSQTAAAPMIPNWYMPVATFAISCDALPVIRTSPRCPRNAVSNLNTYRALPGKMERSPETGRPCLSDGVMTLVSFPSHFVPPPLRAWMIAPPDSDGDHGVHTAPAIGVPRYSMPTDIACIREPFT